MDILLFGHVLGVVLFLGNIITAAFWKIRAEASGDMATVKGSPAYTVPIYSI